MGSGRGDRNQPVAQRPLVIQDRQASMGSGRGDRNQQVRTGDGKYNKILLQWGPVVVTGISDGSSDKGTAADLKLQWGPVVVTGISSG